MNEKEEEEGEGKGSRTKVSNTTNPARTPQKTPSFLYIVKKPGLFCEEIDTCYESMGVYEYSIYLFCF